MKSNFLCHRKQFIQKTLSVLIAIVMLMGIMPFGSVSDFLMSASAAEVPVYDSTLGTYSEENGVLTATPYENAGFRGWFDQSGNEVSIDPVFTIPSGASASDYIPVFYNFNLVKNSSFEEYAVNTNMKTAVPTDEIWEGYCDSEKNGRNDWTTMVISNNRARTGSNSLKLQSQSNTAYHDFYNLEPYTQYTVKFYYNIDPSVAATDTTSAVNNYLSFISVIGDDMEMTCRANADDAEYLAKKAFGTTAGACAEGEWKKAEITFYTEAYTTTRLLICYSSGASPACPLYLDDISLVKDVMSAPTYFNEDFSHTYKNTYVSSNTKSAISLSGGRLKVDALLTYGFVQSAPLKLKKGADYTISFNFDMSEVTDKYVPQLNEAGTAYLIDESKISDDNPNGYVWEIHNEETGSLSSNWINFSLSDTAGLYGSAASNLVIGNDQTDYNTSFVWTVTDANGTASFNPKSQLNQYASAMGFSRATAETTNALDVSKLIVTMKFTADRDCEAYLNARLNGRGTYYIDNLTVTENAENVDVANILVENNIVKALGTAIRTENKQGMRHKTQIDKELLTADNSYGVRVTEYGTVAIKTDYLNGEELTLGGTYIYNENVYSARSAAAYSFSGNVNKVYYEDGTAIHYTGVLMNIAEKHWNEDYTARAYIKYVDESGAEGIAYVDPYDISVYPISKIAYYDRDDAGEFTETEEVRDYLYKNIINKYTDKVVNINNTSAPVSTNFQGIRSTIYHATTFFPDSHGRTYTEEQAAVEMDRLVDSKVDNVRTRFASQWMWTSSGWDWESTKMTAYYKWANMLQDRDISITLQAGWHLHDFIYYYDTFVDETPVGYEEANKDGHSSIPEVNYLHGYTTDNVVMDDIYGEDANAAAIEAAGRTVGLDLDDSEFAHYSVAAARYAEWIKQGLLAFKAHGINNIEYVLPFTETGYAREGDPTYSYDEWTLMAMGLNDALETAGMRSDYKFIGPAQSIYAYQNRLSFIEYLYSVIDGTEYEDLLDINAMHQYTQPHTRQGYENTIYEPYGSYAMAEDNFTYYKDVLETAGVSDMEFWSDEYFAHASDAKWWDNVGMQMTQFAAGLTAGINTGVNRFLTWQMFDTLWDAEATHGIADQPNGSGEFIGGVHATGTCPSLIKVDGKACTIENCPCNNYSYSSYVPHVTYYGINLIGKYMNNENASVYETSVLGDAVQTDGGLYVSAIKNDDGKNVILVVNTTNVITNVDVQLAENDAASYDRYTYDPAAITPTAEATSIPSDKTIKTYETNNFRDIIPPRSFCIYVATDEVFIGDDVDMPFDF